MTDWRVATWSRLDKAAWLTGDLSQYDWRRRRLMTLVPEFSGIACMLVQSKAWIPAVSEITGAHVAVELHHMIVTDRQLNEITASCLTRILNVTWREAATKTAGQDVLETTIKKGWPLCWSCPMHGWLQESKTSTALDSWWEHKLGSTMY